MCESAVHIIKKDKKEELMENIISIKPVNNELVLTDLFGKQTFSKATIKDINLLEHKIILEEE